MVLELSIQRSSTKSFSSFNTMPSDEGTDGGLPTVTAIKVQQVAAPKKPQLMTIEGISAPPVMKNKTNRPSNIFTQFFPSLVSLHANNNQNNPVPPIAKGVFAIQNGAKTRDRLNTALTSSSSFSASSSPPKGDSDSNCHSIEAVWLPSTSGYHNKSLPLVVRRPHHDIFNEADDRKLLKIIMGNAKKLPQTSGKYSCNHIMVNTERIRKRVPPLTRYRDLDRVARDHAQAMADEKTVRHMDGPTELQARILERKDKDSADHQQLFFQRLGVNIARGKSVEDIHKLMMTNLAERNNVLDKRFTTLGMGTARADDGMIYLCQIFGGQ
jgi:hypothetical protein